jgi:hypothetical protein
MADATQVAIRNARALEFIDARLARIEQSIGIEGVPAEQAPPISQEEAEGLRGQLALARDAIDAHKAEIAELRKARTAKATRKVKGAKDDDADDPDDETPAES